MSFQPATTLVCDVPCDLCHKIIRVGTLCVCLPDSNHNSDPWGHVDCVLDAGYEIATNEEDFRQRSDEIVAALEEHDRFNNMQRRALRAEADRAELLAAIAEAKYGASRVRNPSVVALYDIAERIGS